MPAVGIFAQCSDFPPRPSKTENPSVNALCAERSIPDEFFYRIPGFSAAPEKKKGAATKKEALDGAAVVTTLLAERSGNGVASINAVTPQLSKRSTATIALKDDAAAKAVLNSIVHPMRPGAATFLAQMLRGVGARKGSGGRRTERGGRIRSLGGGSASSDSYINKKIVPEEDIMGRGGGVTVSATKKGSFATTPVLGPDLFLQSQFLQSHLLADSPREPRVRTSVAPGAAELRNAVTAALVAASKHTQTDTDVIRDAVETAVATASQRHDGNAVETAVATASQQHDGKEEEDAVETAVATASQQHDGKEEQDDDEMVLATASHQRDGEEEEERDETASSAAVSEEVSETASSAAVLAAVPDLHGRHDSSDTKSSHHANSVLIGAATTALHSARRDMAYSSPGPDTRSRASTSIAQKVFGGILVLLAEVQTRVEGGSTANELVMGANKLLTALATTSSGDGETSSSASSGASAGVAPNANLILGRLYSAVAYWSGHYELSGTKKSAGEEGSGHYELSGSKKNAGEEGKDSLAPTSSPPRRTEAQGRGREEEEIRHIATMKAAEKRYDKLWWEDLVHSDFKDCQLNVFLADLAHAFDAEWLPLLDQVDKIHYYTTFPLAIISGAATLFATWVAISSILRSVCGCECCTDYFMGSPYFPQELRQSLL